MNGIFREVVTIRSKEILNADSGEDVVVVELFEPSYNPENNSLQYKVSILKQPNHSYAVFNDSHDDKIPQRFGAVALFIDGCPSTEVVCKKDSGKICGFTDCDQCYSGCTEVGLSQKCWCGLWPHCMDKNASEQCEKCCQTQFGTDCDNFIEW